MKCRATGCDEPYRDFGDGYVGWCPSCADLLYVIEDSGSLVDWNAEWTRDEIERVAADVRKRGEAVEVVTLAHVRRMAGLSQRQLAKRMGIGQSSVARIEKAWPKVKLSTAHRYAHACGARLRLEFDLPDEAADG